MFCRRLKEVWKTGEFRVLVLRRRSGRRSAHRIHLRRLARQKETSGDIVGYGPQTNKPDPDNADFERKLEHGSSYDKRHHEKEETRRHALQND